MLEILTKIANWIAIHTGFWDFVSSVGYMVAALGGTIGLILYIATQDKKFSNFSIVVVVLYLILKAFLAQWGVC